MVANFLFWWTKQIFFLVIKLEPPILSWLQPRKNNRVPTELDVSISAIIVHRIESICTDRPMSRLHISVLENWHVQLLYRPIYYLHTSSAKIHKGMEIKLCISHWFVRKCWTMIFFQLFWWSPCALDFWVFVMSHMT